MNLSTKSNRIFIRNIPNWYFHEQESPDDWKEIMNKIDEQDTDNRGFLEALMKGAICELFA